MDTKYKNYLFIAATAALAAFAVAAVSFAVAYYRSVEPSSFRSFSVSGDGKAIAIPDVAQFTFSVLVQGGKDIAALQKENTEKTNKIISFIKESGVEKKDIQTQNYNLEPRYQYFSCPNGLIFSGGQSRPCPPPEIVGYSVNQTVLVKIRDFEKIGILLSGAVENGANSVSNLSFAVDDPTEVQNQARAEAIQKAKVKAMSIAKAGGFRLGRLLSISEGGFYPQAYRFETLKADVSAPASLPSPTIEPGSEEVSVNVTMSYEIK